MVERTNGRPPGGGGEPPTPYEVLQGIIRGHGQGRLLFNEVGFRAQQVTTQRRRVEYTTRAVRSAEQGLESLRRRTDPHGERPTHFLVGVGAAAALALGAGIAAAISAWHLSVVARLEVGAAVAALLGAGAAAIAHLGRRRVWTYAAVGALVFAVLGGVGLIRGTPPLIGAFEAIGFGALGYLLVTLTVRTLRRTESARILGRRRALRAAEADRDLEARRLADDEEAADLALGDWERLVKEEALLIAPAAGTEHAQWLGRCVALARDLAISAGEPHLDGEATTSPSTDSTEES